MSTSDESLVTVLENVGFIFKMKVTALVPVWLTTFVVVVPVWLFGFGVGRMDRCCLETGDVDWLWYTSGVQQLHCG